MGYKTINPDTASEAERHALSVLGLGVGDRLYVQKRGKLTSGMVRAALFELKSVGASSAIVDTLASRLKRDRVTVARHLRRMALDTTTSSDEVRS